jgi:hypothetical protein
LDALAAQILKLGDRAALGPMVQTVIGQLFVPDYRGTAESWQAAVTLDVAVRSFNPLRHIWWAATGRVRRSREILANMTGGNLAGLHATAIAIHNLVDALERMRDLAGRADALRRYTGQEAASICLKAPDSVLRQAVAIGTTGSGSFRRGTLVQLQLEAARASSLRPDIAFMTSSWSRCPAHAWVPALLAAVWERVATARQDMSSGQEAS